MGGNKMKHIVLILIIASSLFAKEGDISQHYATNKVVVDGLVAKKLILTVESLEKMSGVKTGSTPLVCISGEIKDEVKSYEGVKLKDILAEADIVTSSKRDLNKIYIQVIASDGYAVIFSYNELFNTNNGDRVIVFYKKNNQFLEEYEGKIALISLDDNKNGPRHVKWLEKIIVKKIDL